MKGRAIFLTALMVVSMAVAGVGGASAATATDSAHSTQQAPAQFEENTTNATPQASGTGGSGDSLPQPIDVPQNELKNATLDRSSIPSRLGRQKSGGYSISSKDKASSASVQGSTYNPNPKQLTWFGYDGTGQAGTYYFKDYSLRAVGPHVEVWVANNLSWPSGDPRETPSVSDQQAAYLADQFETSIYPKESKLFRKPDFRAGKNATLYGPPGPNGTVPDGYYETADNTSRTVLLVDNIRDKNYYNSNYPVYTAGLSSPTIDDYTDRNVAFIDAYRWDNYLGGPDAPWKKGTDRSLNRNYSVEGTTAHEYQHVLHGAVDPDETTWINEGFSDFAIYSTGYGLDEGHINAYSSHPENSLVNWGDEGQINILRDYGGAFLFQLYTNQRFGTDFTKALFNDPKNGIKSVNDALDAVGANEDFYDLYQDFQTMLVTDGKNAPKKYQLNVTDLDVNTSHDVPNTENNTTAAYGNAYNPLGSKSGSVDSLDVSGAKFTPTPWTSVEDPTGDTGHKVLYSGKGNGLDNFAIFDADLSAAQSPTLEFDTNYDIESGYDYAFVQVSTDGGKTWQSLSNGDTTSYRHSFIDPTVEANLPGFTNSTNDAWVDEQFDLSKYAGKDVLIGFRYVTDGASIQPGIYVRDVSVPGAGISYSGASTKPFESRREAQQNYLRYAFSLIGVNNDGSTAVKHYDPTEFKNGDTRSLKPLLDGDYDHTYLAASWAPESEEGGVVPYGYDVNAGGSGPPAGENTLRFVGTGPATDYTFSVEHALAKSTAGGANVNRNDHIRRGYVGTGVVGTGADSYTFDGNLQTLKVDSSAVDVYLNGKKLSASDIHQMPSKAVEVEGTGPRATYHFSATGAQSLQKLTANNANLNANDHVYRTTANGVVGSARDAYGYYGRLDSLKVDGDATVYVDGVEQNPATYNSHVVTIVGSGNKATYSFDASGHLAKSIANFANRNHNDKLSGHSANGVVGAAADSYTYTGRLSNVEFNGDVTVYIDGRMVKQGQVGS